MKRFLASALAMASLAGAFAPAAQASEVRKETRKDFAQIPVPEVEIPIHNYRRRTDFDVLNFLSSGLTPKEYGQRLQVLGRQKWTKSKRRK